MLTAISHSTIDQRPLVPQATPSLRTRACVVFAKTCVVVICSSLFAWDWLAPTGWWKTWVAFAVMFLLAATTRPMAMLGYGLILGLLAIGASFWWAQDMLAYVIDDDGISSWILFGSLTLWESLIFVIVLFCISLIRQRQTSSVGLLLPVCLWIGIEAYMPRVFHWAAGHALLDNSLLVQIVDLGGVSMASLVVLTVACLPVLVYDLFASTNRQRLLKAKIGLAGCAAMLLFSTIYGYVRLNGNALSNTSQILTLGVVQEDPSYRDSMVKMRERSLSLGKVDLLVWPESTLGVHSLELSSFNDSLDVLGKSRPPMINPESLVGLPAPVVVGGRSFFGVPAVDSPVYQTAFLIDPTGKILDRYHKRSLMPLGEYVPGESSFPWLHNWFQLGEYFAAGESDRPLVLQDNARIGMIICYEDTMSEVTRRTVVEGANVLVCIINDSAFRSPIALQQHLKLARMRAIENRRTLVRAAGGGISCAIDPTGQASCHIAPDQAGAFSVPIELRDQLTLFHRLGNWPPLVAVMGVLAILVAGSRVRPASKGSASA
jgi:apolipoprotein N-acyltransferase